MSAACADEWRTSQDGTLYGYSDMTALRPMPPTGNQIAGQLSRSDNLEARFNLKAENETFRLTARPVVALRQINNTAQHETYLSQYQLLARVNDSWNLSAGRELLNWGPAQFRSPSSPFYFDNGRSNPMRELSGMDVLKLTRSTDSSIQLVRVKSSGHSSSDLWHNAWLMKLDLHGEDWSSGFVAAKAPQRAGFYGAHGQLTVSDALLAYTELSSSTQTATLNSPADPTLPFSISTESTRKLTALIGTAYTFESGQSLNAEYLHDGHGYHAAEQQAYFSRATASPLNAAMALAYSPRLLGRDYLHLVWQSNLMAADGYWRLMATHSLTDGGNELSGYSEYSINSSLTAFLLGLLPSGSARQEFSSLFRYSVTAGIKVALP
jgi:hypothetical protein